MKKSAKRKWLGVYLVLVMLYEAFFAVPVLGELLYERFFLLLVVIGIVIHFIAFQAMANHNTKSLAPFFGMAAGLLGFVPILGSVVHGVTAFLYMWTLARRRGLFYELTDPGDYLESVNAGESVQLGDGEDDLTLIEGIGPEIDKALKSEGILSYKVLAAMHPDKITVILTKHEIHGHVPTTWPEQALLARDENWRELKQWQDILIGGVEPEKVKITDKK